MPENGHLYQAPRKFLGETILDRWLSRPSKKWGTEIIDQVIQRGDYNALSSEHKQWYFKILANGLGQFNEEKILSFFTSASPCHVWLASLDYHVELAYRQRYQASYPAFSPFILKAYDKAFDPDDYYKASSGLREWVLKQWKETGTDCGFLD